MRFVATIIPEATAILAHFFFLLRASFTKMQVFFTKTPTLSGYLKHQKIFIKKSFQNIFDPGTEKVQEPKEDLGYFLDLSDHF